MFSEKTTTPEDRALPRVLWLLCIIILLRVRLEKVTQCFLKILMFLFVFLLLVFGADKECSRQRSEVFNGAQFGE